MRIDAGEDLAAQTVDASSVSAVALSGTLKTAATETRSSLRRPVNTTLFQGTYSAEIITNAVKNPICVTNSKIHI